MPNFSPPHDPTGRNEPSFMTNLYGASWSVAWNTSIYGRPIASGANVLSNCVGYAQGRMLDIYREITGYNPAQTQTHPFIMFNAEAGQWADVARANGFTVQDNPRAGSVLVTGSHVAVVETYDQNAGLWNISESGFEDQTPYHYHQSLYQSGGHWYSSYASDPLVIGFILIPNVTPGPGPGPHPFPESDHKFIYYLKNWNNDLY